MDEIVHKKGKIYYSIGEVAELFDVNASLIRFWEKKFDVLKPHKNKKGTRMFTPQDVDNFKLIYHLVKERGMTLAGAQQRLKDNKQGTMRDMEIVDRLLSIRAMLVEIREELKNDGEVFSPEGYLDEDGEVLSLEASVEEDDEIIIITEDVRTEVVTDGSSPWDESDDESGDLQSLDKIDETVQDDVRDAAMEELRNVKDIPADWEDNDEIKQGLSLQENAQKEHTSDGSVGLGNIFDDNLDATDEYADPWEEVGDEEPAIEQTNEPKPGEIFGTDGCTTFSPDDKESDSSEQEPKKPHIYEQTLF